MRQGINIHFCGYCGTKIDLPVLSGIVDESKVQEQRMVREPATFNSRSSFEASLVTLKRIAANKGKSASAPQCFISYSRGVPVHERWVVRLASDLRNSGIGVVLDRWDNAEPGLSIGRFVSLIQGCEFIAVVGTPEYRVKYENAGMGEGYVVAAEFDLIGNRLLGTESNKRSILPLLLSGNVEEAFPPLLHGRVYVDFRQEDHYFGQLLDAVIKMLGLPFDDSGVIELRESMLDATWKAGSRTVA